MRPRATLRKPAILGRRLYSLVIRAVVITTMAFAVAFGFLSGATSPSAHYDPYMFAIGVSSLFGAACGAMGILILAHPSDEGRAARARSEPRRGGGPQLGNPGSPGTHRKLLRSAGRRDRAPERLGGITYANDAFCALAGRDRETILTTDFALPVLEQGETTRPCRRHARPRPKDRRRGRRALDRLARSQRPLRRLKRNAERRPRRHRPRQCRARTRRSARPGGDGEPRQVAFPGDGVARDPHAPERHSRHGRPSWRHAAVARAVDLSESGENLRRNAAVADRRGARFLQDRSRQA